MRRSTAARQIEFADVGTTQLEGTVLLFDHAPGAEVAHWQTTDVVGQVRHHRRTQAFEVVDGRLLAEFGPVFPNRAHHFLTVMEGRHLVCIDDDGLDSLAAHDGAHTTARRQPGGPAIRIGKGNSGHQTQVLADRAADSEADLLAVLFKE